MSDKHAKFNNCKHQFVTLTDNIETVSILTPSGKQITICVLEAAKSADIKLHNNCEKFKTIGFNGGRESFHHDVTLQTLIL